MIQCPDCDKTFTNHRALNGHQNAHGGPIQQRKRVRLTKKLLQLADHIEMEHEREMPGMWTYDELKQVHDQMHASRDDWNHK